MARPSHQYCGCCWTRSAAITPKSRAQAIAPSAGFCLPQPPTGGQVISKGEEFVEGVASNARKMGRGSYQDLDSRRTRS